MGVSLLTSHLIFLLVTASACGLAPIVRALPSATPRPATAVPTSISDNSTAAAQRRATRQAQSTRDALATQGPAATQTAAAAAKVTQTADALAAATAARATTQALYTAEHTWPQRVTESFADNQLGWPVGLTQDQYLGVTTTVAGGHYQWLTNIASDGAYTNLVPAKGPVFSDFYAAVTVHFVQGNDDGQTAYGLAFRLVNENFGFFGILKNGSYLVLESHGSNLDQTYLDSSPAIDTHPDAANRLAVVGSGADFVCLVNDEPVSEIGANLAPGQIGVGVEGVKATRPAQVDFTDFEVRAP